MSDDTEYKDVVIIGAGLSGIGAACYLKRNCPSKTFSIIEARSSIGGTWDLFKYPGVRSDSDMYTLGYKFKPWEGAKAIADGPSILNYIVETANENNILDKINFNKTLVEATWNSNNQNWQLIIQDSITEKQKRIDCNFLYMCAGYYSYSNPHSPEFPDIDKFEGEVIHPQLWPKDVIYENKNIIVIGSGATAVTLVPELATKAKKVTMLQRSPTYMISRPSEDWFANLMKSLFPKKLAYSITRTRNILFQEYIYKKSRRHPNKVKKKLLDGVIKELGNEVDIEKHFTPSYAPWDQRLCLIPDSNFFNVVKNKTANVVTDKIKSFDAKGIQLESKNRLDADIIITATGLNLQLMGGARVKVDNEDVDFSKLWTYKGVMVSSVPNFVSIFGYINASWTLRADLISQWVCNLLNHMDDTESTSVVPITTDDHLMSARSWIGDFSSGYMERAMKDFPKQSDTQPWINSQDYRREKKLFNQPFHNDQELVFSKGIT